MAETRAQMLARHDREKQTAIEQHEIRMRTMRERHHSELMLATDQAGRTDTRVENRKQKWLVDMSVQRDAFFLRIIGERFPREPLESLKDRITRRIYPDREELLIDGKIAGTFCTVWTPAKREAL